MIQPEADIWKSYCDFLCPRWQINPRHLWNTGLYTRGIIKEESRYQGNNLYTKSAFIALRNIVYGIAVLSNRKSYFATHASRFVEPILDFGCGMGVGLRFLQEEYGFEDLVGLDLPGTQLDLLREYAKPHEIEVIEDLGDRTFGTILCTNTLEHIEGASELVVLLRSRCEHLLANIDIHAPKEGPDDPLHVVPIDERLEIKADLLARGEWFDIRCE